MEKCPVCRAKLKGKTVCPRCQTDFTHLSQIEKSASDNYLTAQKCYEDGAYEQMLSHAKRSFSLKKNKDTLSLIILASILNKQYDDAMNLWRNFLHI